MRLEQKLETMVKHQGPRFENKVDRINVSSPRNLLATQAAEFRSIQRTSIRLYCVNWSQILFGISSWSMKRINLSGTDEGRRLE